MAAHLLGTRDLLNGSSPSLNYTDRAIITHIHIDHLVVIINLSCVSYLRRIEVTARGRPELAVENLALGPPQGLTVPIILSCRSEGKIIVLISVKADNSPSNPFHLVYKVCLPHTNYRALYCLRLCKGDS